jgi:hypothetical protein
MDTEAETMSHPTRVQWTDYLYDECEPAEEARLAEHLNDCPECRRILESWRSALGELDAYVAAAPARRRPWLARLRRWAAAAAVLLAVGYGLGRAAAPDAEALRMQIEPAMRAQWQADLAAAREELTRESEERALATLDTARSAAASLIAGYARAFDNVRRSDLRTLAAATEQELRRTRWQLANAVAGAQPASSIWTTPESPNTKEAGSEG